MDINSWEEASKYLWKGYLTGSIYQFKVEEGWVWYKRAGSDWLMWDREGSISVIQDLLETGYKNIGENPEYVYVSSQEKVCKKIALMEQRWLNFQQRKQHG